jgi:hypothetical protein
MSTEIQLEYDAEQQRAVLTFPGGRQLKLSGVSKEKAEEFRTKHGAEFQRRDCCLTTAGVIVTREGGNG